MNQRKRQVIDSALQLFIEKGFHNTSIQEILDRAKISKGTFYNYFSSKNECFMAILEQSRYEANLRRHEILLGKDVADEQVLIEQIIVLMKINKEQNLIPLFEGIFQSNDAELRSMLARYRLYEVEWVSNRFVDVFGEEARPFTFELTITFFGIIQHLSMTYRSSRGIAIEADKIVNVAFRNIKAILPVMNSGDILLTQDLWGLIESKVARKSVSKEDVLEKLIGFHEGLIYDNAHCTAVQFTESLLDEFKRDNLRIAVIETLLKSFRESLEGTPHIAETIEIANLMWYFLKNIQESK
ncbi:TetR family transcriptional regulator [Solibacillus sp. R5-41]|uniref:TetR/AcrR family transcriptional regulator n=1 Tax=Solibacillus sp. R5-41 TaxID=2048654 RepID=UPI000C125014|nr:TetR/AcrR family transcriptional regulator [Solibacillus sp. R5-41]ATP41373.1 TetR family transcriptional regulator [Solibacillus sp. R5-41]